MTLFTITGDPTQYRYPEANEDVLLGQYLEYLERIAPKEPPEVAQLRAAYAKLAAMQEDVFPWMNKAGVPRDADAFDIAEGLANFLAGPEATKKAKTLLPPLLLEWNKAHDEAEAALDSMDRVWYASKMLPYIAEVVAQGIVVAGACGAKPDTAFGVLQKAQRVVFVVQAGYVIGAFHGLAEGV